jgi:hypothetical protein
MNDQEMWDILDASASMFGRINFDRLTMINIAKLDCFMITRRRANNLTLAQLKRWCQDWYKQYGEQVDSDSNSAISATGKGEG